MRAFLSSLLLFFYTITCTGMTVYLHECHKGYSIALQDEGQKENRSCLSCPHHSSKKACTTVSQAYEFDGDNCCKDIKIDLRKGQEIAENTAAVGKLPILSPVTLSIIWKVLLQPYFDIAQLQLVSDQPILSKRSAPPYLLHCNFRI